MSRFSTLLPWEISGPPLPCLCSKGRCDYTPSQKERQPSVVVKSQDFGVTNLLNQNLKIGDGAAAVLTNSQGGRGAHRSLRNSVSSLDRCRSPKRLYLNTSLRCAACLQSLNHRFLSVPPPMHTSQASSLGPA